MIELWNEYWPVILVGLLIGLAVGYLVFRPRQRVTLSQDTPVRPHMTGETRPHSDGITDEAARATSDVAGQFLGTQVSAQLPGGDGAPDRLETLKGVGPKLAALLNAQGLTRFDQIASLSPGQIEALDSQLGAFRGRLAGDRIIEQAHYLARGDHDGYSQKFGAL